VDIFIYLFDLLIFSVKLEVKNLELSFKVFGSDIYTMSYYYEKD
jgi:hypothetical protein